MSYDLAILPAIEGLTTAQIAEGFDRMDQGQAYPFGEPTETLENCAKEIWEHFPPLSELNDGEPEHTIWACDHSTVDGFMYLTMFLSVDQPTLNQITSIARKHGFVVFDPQTNNFRSHNSTQNQSFKKKLIGLFSKQKDI